MAIGGETVGAAAIRVLADGTGLDDDIADQFDSVDAGVTVARLEIMTRGA